MFFSHSASKRIVSLHAGIVCAGLLLAAQFGSAATPPQNQPYNSTWVATWGAGMVATEPGAAPDFSGKTLRQIVHTSVAGQRVRIWLSNRFGIQSLYVGAAHVALSATGSVGVNEDGTPNQSAIQAGSDRTLTFHGIASVVIPPGAVIVSDPVPLDVPAFSDLAISTYFPGYAMGDTEHTLALQTSYAATGNVADAPTLVGKSWPLDSWYFLAGVDVYAPGDSAVVMLGDSITDGDHSSPGENHRWPNFLAARLAASPATQKAGVLGTVDSGIDGNSVLLDGGGPNALSRIDRDILARSGARYLIVLESINDIGRYTTDHQPYGDLAARLEAGLAQIAAQAHQHNMVVIGATLTPYQGCEYYSAAGDAVRQALNQWIRTSPTFDGVADFDKAVRDPQKPLHFAAQYDSGDHLHPKDAGYKAMANAIDLSLFTRNR